MACPVSISSIRGGANLPNQDEVFADREHFGRIFFNQANLSARGIAQIAVVMGSCTAGGAYVPAMSDESIIVRDQGTIFLGGPPLVKAATGEVVTAEDLGGGDVHTRLSGVVDHLGPQRCACARDCAVDRREPEPARVHAGLIGLRWITLKPGSGCAGVAAGRHDRKPTGTRGRRVRPRARGRRCRRVSTPASVYGVIPTDTRKPFDIREVLARIVDDSAFDEFKARYGQPRS